MADYCFDCVERIFGVSGDKNDLSLPWFWPFPRRRVELCEGCGLIVVDPAGCRVEDVPPHAEADS